MSIKVKDLSKNYGPQKALDTVTFSVESGEIVGFLGPNGAGKSTCMKILTSYLPPDSGMVRVAGLDVESASLELKKKVGYLPEQNPLYLDMYVKEFLSFVGRIHRLDNLKNRVTEMIEMTGLELEQNKKIKSLSKGYQ
ncbi:MAG: ATP-binding cassette domain-containing protein, partial [Bacteroidetes bacterium]|nr:ATP-binding cassette domain-containing protein [Bacteroidota bacterium]